MVSSATAPPPSVRSLPRINHRLPLKLPQAQKLWHDVFSLSSAFSSLKGSREYILPSFLSAESRRELGRILCLAPHLCEPKTLSLDWSAVTIAEARSEEELLASVRLRVRSFYEFNQSFNIEVSEGEIIVSDCRFCVSDHGIPIVFSFVSVRIKFITIVNKIRDLRLRILYFG